MLLLSCSLRFLQIWIKPDAKGLKPNYGSRQFAKADRHNKFQQVVTSYTRHEEDTGSGLIPIHQDVNMFVAELDAGVSQSLPLRKGRQAYGVCIEGGVSVGDGSTEQHLVARDAFEVRSPSQALSFDASLMSSSTPSEQGSVELPILS